MLHFKNLFFIFKSLINNFIGNTDATNPNKNPQVGLYKQVNPPPLEKTGRETTKPKNKYVKITSNEFLISKDNIITKGQMLFN